MLFPTVGFSYQWYCGPGMRQVIRPGWWNGLETCVYSLAVHWLPQGHNGAN